MVVYSLRDNLEKYDINEIMKNEKTADIFVINSMEVDELISLTEIEYEGDISLREVEFNKFEIQQECLIGSLCIPRLLDMSESRYRIQIYIDKKYIIFIDDTIFSERIINRIRQHRARNMRKRDISDTNASDNVKIKRTETRERFLYHFFSELLDRDVEILRIYEQRLMEMEENILEGKVENFHEKIIPLGRELLLLRRYYDELMDMGRELESNENGFFIKKQLKYFGGIADRADRLMSRASHLLDYTNQIKDAYQAQNENNQNKNMTFLTIISTVFYPLTLITGWYGMNFKNMPELENGYPGVIYLSVLVLIICVIIFKKKKIF